MEWGTKAYELMWELKQLFDADFVLNPGVILNRDPDSHRKFLKPSPVASDIINRCIECGFCESNCPSKDLTLTPRQRIATYKEIARLRDMSERTEEQSARLKAFEGAFEYDGDATCAADGMCQEKCPVKINTGALPSSLFHHLVSASTLLFVRYGVRYAVRGTYTQRHLRERRYRCRLLPSRLVQGLCQVFPAMDAFDASRGLAAGDLIKSLRSEHMAAWKAGSSAAMAVANNFGAVTAMVPYFLSLVDAMHRVVGPYPLQMISSFLTRATSNYVPEWNPHMPRGAASVKSPPKPVAAATTGAGIPRKVVYMPSCVTRMMGPSLSDTERGSVHEKLMSIFDKVCLLPPRALLCVPLLSSLVWVWKRSQGADRCSDRLDIREDDARQPAQLSEAPHPLLLRPFTCSMHHAPQAGWLPLPYVPLGLVPGGVGGVVSALPYLG